MCTQLTTHTSSFKTIYLEMWRIFKTLRKTRISNEILGRDIFNWYFNALVYIVIPAAYCASQVATLRANVICRCKYIGFSADVK